MGHVIQNKGECVAQVFGQPVHRLGQPIQRGAVFGDLVLSRDFPIAPTCRVPGVGRLPSAPVVGGVNCNAVKPRRDLGRGPLAGELCWQRGADILGQILGFGPHARQAKAKGK